MSLWISFPCKQIPPSSKEESNSIQGTTVGGACTRDVHSSCVVCCSLASKLKDWRVKINDRVYFGFVWRLSALLKQVNELPCSTLRYIYKKTADKQLYLLIQCSSSKASISSLGSLRLAVCQAELFTPNEPLHRHPCLVFQRSHTLPSLRSAADCQQSPASFLSWSPLPICVCVCVCEFSVHCSRICDQMDRVLNELLSLWARNSGKLHWRHISALS